MAKLVSIQQAAANALVAYLDKSVNNPTVYPKPDEPVKFEPRWPDPRAMPHRAVTLVLAGERTNGNDPILGWWHASQDVTAQYPSTLPPNIRMFRWTVGWYEQPCQLDVWAPTYDDRDDIIARLDIALHAGPGESTSYSPAGYPVGDPVVDYIIVPLAQSDGWPGAFGGAYFTDNGPQLIDTPISTQRTMFRATWRGTLEVLLTVDAPSYKMAKIKFQQQRLAQAQPFPGTLAPDIVVTLPDDKITPS